MSPKCAKFIENQESRPEVQNKLSALLIGPIQRVPRYKLLLTQLVELTTENESGFSLLQGMHIVNLNINITFIRHNS